MGQAISIYDTTLRDGAQAEAIRVRVLIESTDGRDIRTTVGVSTDIIEASRPALVDSIENKLMQKIQEKSRAFL